MKNLDHPNVVKLLEFYEDNLRVHLVLEYVPGGQLLDFMAK